MKPELLTLIGTLSGTIIGVAGTSLATYITQKYNYRLNIRKLLIDTGIKDWEKTIELASQQRGRKRVHPLFSYIVMNASILDLLDKGKLTKHEIEKVLGVTREITDIIEKHTEEMNKKESR